jgi:phospholipid transport system substrate-binding protein
MKSLTALRLRPFTRFVAPAASALVFLALLALGALAPSAAQAPTAATRFIDDRSRAVIALVNDRTLSAEERESRLHDIALEVFDVPSIARWVLGRYWASATPAEREEYGAEFEHYMVHVYAGRFRLYPDAKLKFTGERTENDRTVVRSQITWRAATAPATVDWWVRKSGNTYKIIDVTVEGVSQLLLWREEFASVIKDHNGKVNGLIEHLKEKTGS